MAGYLAHALSALYDATQLREAATAPDEKARLSKHELIMYGVAALTLDAARVDMGLTLPDPIVSERDQFVALAYMLRCAPAHDIAMPVWKIRGRFDRAYTVGNHTIDLTNLDGKPFELTDIGGPEAFIDIAQMAQGNGWA